MKIYNPIDVYIGTQLRRKRLESSISQEELGNAIGITFQQVQKYEKGLNRISSRVLYHISRIFNIHIEYFFQDLSEIPYETLTAFCPALTLADPKAIYGAKTKDPNHERTQNEPLDEELNELIEMYKSVDDLKLKKQILSLVKTFSGN